MKMVNIGGLSLRLETFAALEGVVEISGRCLQSGPKNHVINLNRVK